MTEQKAATATASASGGIGFFGALTLLLIALKLMGYTSYSWLVAWSPLLIAMGLFVTIILVILLVGFVAVFLKK